MRPITRQDYNETNVPTVSGGKDNPPDRYVLVELGVPPDANLSEINRMADQGYRFAGVLPIGSFNYLLMGNYKENK